MKIEQYSFDRHFEQAFGLLNQHGAIARREVTLDKDRFAGILSDVDNYVVCAVNDDGVSSFMLTRPFKFMPTWCVRLVVAKPQVRFNPIRNGICALYDTVIPYWEERGLNNFIYTQPQVFSRRANSLTRSGSKRLSEYTPHDYHVVPAGEHSTFDFIRFAIQDDKIFPEPMLVRWLFKS